MHVYVSSRPRPSVGTLCWEYFLGKTLMTNKIPAPNNLPYIYKKILLTLWVQSTTPIQEVVGSI